jgi:hypothetical protein
LGNQIFQLTAGLGLADATSRQLFVQFNGRRSGLLEAVIPPRVAEATGGTVRRAFLPRRASSVTASGLRIVGRELASSFGALSYIEQRSEQAFDGRPDGLERVRAPVLVLDGYFQHPSWFEPALEEVAARLSNFLARHQAATIARSTLVVSFRRGDYCQLGWDLPMSYYEAAVSEIGSTAGEALIVSDDRMLALLAGAWFERRGLAVRSLPDVEDHEVRDLALLANAESVVMANSTFSWWGVVAGDSRGEANRRVAMPVPWLPIGGESALGRLGWLTVGVR